MTSLSPATNRHDQANGSGSNARLNPPSPALGMSILGNGFFVVRDPRTDASYATQVGSFKVDSDGYVVTAAGARLQGRSDGLPTATGDLRINAASLPPGAVPGSIMLCYAIDDWGRITVQLSDGSSFLCGQVMLQNFQDPQALVNEGNGLYSNMDPAGPLPALSAPGSNGLGAIESNVLELSSVEQINEAA
jgi:flagellar hook protein FlgE